MTAACATVLLVVGVSLGSGGPRDLASEFARPIVPPATMSPVDSGAAGEPVRPGRLLAQRSIEREWGLSEDSAYVELDVRNWKSEPFALASSAAIPGLGQLYAGEGSGWWYLMAEVGGWVGRHYSQRKAERYTRQAALTVGDPNDSSSVFSFERYARSSGRDPSALQVLWASDRSAFYEALANDGTWFAGFRNDSFEGFADLHGRADDTKRQTRWIETAMWFNHVWGAFDALRAARFHNLPLRSRLPVKLGASPGPDGVRLTAALSRRF